MDFNLIYLESWDSEFKGKKFTMYRFLDTQSLTTINGTDLKGDFIQYKSYKCHVEWKNNKLKVVSVN